MGENGHKGHSHVLDNINYRTRWLADVEAHLIVGFSLSVALSKLGVNSLAPSLTPLCFFGRGVRTSRHDTLASVDAKVFANWKVLKEGVSSNWKVLKEGGYGRPSKS